MNSLGDDGEILTSFRVYDSDSLFDYTVYEQRRYPDARQAAMKVSITNWSHFNNIFIYKAGRMVRSYMIPFGWQILDLSPILE